MNYIPIVSVDTKGIGDKSDAIGLKSKVKDNGEGIPQKVLDNISTLFYHQTHRRKTGWGLRLSFDIIKAHCGDMK